MGDMSHISVKSINYSTNVPYIVNNDDNNDNDAGHMLTTIVHLWSMTR